MPWYQFNTASIYFLNQFFPKASAKGFSLVLGRPGCRDLGPHRRHDRTMEIIGTNASVVSNRLIKSIGLRFRINFYITFGILFRCRFFMVFRWHFGPLLVQNPFTQPQSQTSLFSKKKTCVFWASIWASIFDGF